MGAIAGVFRTNEDELDLRKLMETMKMRGPEGIELLKTRDGVLLHGRKQGQRMGVCCRSISLKREKYQIVFSGSIFNSEDLQQDLGISSKDTAEMLLEAYIRWGEDFPSRLNGVFTIAIWEEAKKKLFLARDPMGAKPLFYKEDGQGILFGSEIKYILALPGVKAQLDRQGLYELLMLGPGRLPGSGVLKGIRELEPGCCAVYHGGRLKIRRYWFLRDGPHRDSFRETCEKVRYLIEDAVRLQIRQEPQAGAFLSGGLDSSILSSLYVRSRGELQSFSVDYQHNREHFVPGKFLPESDGDYIGRMQEYLGSIHRETVLTAQDLYDGLRDAVICRDLPGMADVDSSLLCFCRDVRKHVPAVLSGECADEIFGGYPWFRDPSFRQEDGFPWARNRKLRSSLLPEGWEEAEDFVSDLYADACSQADLLPGQDPQDQKVKVLTSLNMRWFMQTLMDRNDRISAAAGLTVLVPFCDVRIAQYLYRVPWAMKDFGGREKGLLRQAAKGLLPESVRLRKKSPYPKTFDPAYEQLTEGKMKDLLSEDSPLWYLVSRKAAIEILGSGLFTPWYGQLMGRPQFMAWLLQIDFWLRHYEIELCF